MKRDGVERTWGRARDRWCGNGGASAWAGMAQALAPKVTRKPILAKLRFPLHDPPGHDPYFDAGAWLFPGPPIMCCICCIISPCCIIWLRICSSRAL